MSQLSFVARVIHGAGRGASIGTPTMNVDVADIPHAVQDGIYAGWVWINGAWMQAAFHVGPRPVFHDSRSVEAHVLDANISHAPEHLHITLLRWLRPVRMFASVELLQEQITSDIARCRAILSAYDTPAPPQIDNCTA